MGIIQRQTLQSSAFSYLGIVVGFVSQAILAPILLTKDQVGLIGLLPPMALLMAQFANLGINNAGGRFFPYFRNTSRQHNGYLLLAFGITTIGLLACALGLAWYRPVAVAENSAKSGLFVDYYYWLLPLTVVLISFYILDNYAKLLFATVYGTFLANVVLRLGVLLALGLYGLKIIDFQGFMFVWLAAYTLPTVLMGVYVRRKHGLWLRPRFLHVPPALRRDMARYAGLTIVSGLSSQLIWTIDKAMLNSSAGLGDTGVYSTAAYFASVIALPATALYKVAGIVVAEAWKNNDLPAIGSIYQKSCLNQLLIGALVFVGIMANLPNVFRFLPGGYEAGSIVILWLGVGKLIDMATGINGLILNTSHKYVWDSVFLCVTAGLTVALNLWLIPAYGITGAAIGAAIATTAYNLARTVFVWAKFGLQPFSWRNGAVILLMLAVWALAVWPAYAGPNAPAWHILADVAGRSIGITAVFGGLVYALRLSPDAVQMANRVWGRLAR